MMLDVPAARSAFISVLLGALLALTLPPLPTGVLAPLVLAALLYHAARQPRPAAFAAQIFWATLTMTAVHLWWLTAFVGHIVGVPALGLLAFLLYALEGSFYALAAYLVASVCPAPLSRVWGLAGAWVLLEALRFIGPFAFPWPTLGYAFLDTPLMQVADLGGVLLASVLLTATAAALVTFWQGRAAPLWLMAALWIAGLSYGVTRQPGQGPAAQAVVERSGIDVFAKATGGITPPAMLAQYLRPVSGVTFAPGEVMILPETAVWDEGILPGQRPGLYGLSGRDVHSNQAVTWDGQQITASNDKARPVPFGEYFPLRQELAPFWNIIERVTGMGLDSLTPARTLTPLPLNGLSYGAYICYDSVFPWVARQLTSKGANVLVNISNDGWYTGWGVQQHFAMGRVRAIENRRWVLRSVNEGIAGSIDDLGRPRQTLGRGEGALHVRYPALQGQTVYNRVGDFPALLLAAALLLAGRLRFRA